MEAVGYVLYHARAMPCRESRLEIIDVDMEH